MSGAIPIVLAIDIESDTRHAPPGGGVDVSGLERTVDAFGQLRWAGASAVLESLLQRPLLRQLVFVGGEEAVARSGRSFRTSGDDAEGRARSRSDRWAPKDSKKVIGARTPSAQVLSAFSPPAQQPPRNHTLDRCLDGRSGICRE